MRRGAEQIQLLKIVLCLSISILMPTIEILAKGTSITNVTTDSEFTIQSTEYVNSPHDDVLLFLCNSQSQLDQLHALKVRVQ